MAKCSFCGKQILQGRGVIFVEVSGKINNFCSSKCKKNRRMGRDPLKLKWIQKIGEKG